MSDILITTQIDNVKTVDIPTFLEKAETYLEQLGHIKVNGLKQKIYVINDLFALSLSGSVYEMKTFLEDIKFNFKLIETTPDNIKGFIENYDKEIIIKISIGVSFYHKGKGFFFVRVGLDWRENQHDLFGKLSVCGNGGSWFIEDLSKLLNEQNTNNFDYQNLADHRKKIEILKSGIFIQIGNFIFRERVYGDTIKELWGGGFEMISFENGAFKKIDDYTYVIVRAEFDKDGGLRATPFLAVNYKYYGDVLLLTCTDFY